MEDREGKGLSKTLRVAAPYVAKGMPLNEVADLCGVASENTVIGWMDIPKFREEVERYERVFSRQAARRSRQVLIDAINAEEVPLTGKISAAKTLLLSNKNDEENEQATQVINFLGMTTPETTAPDAEDE